MPIPTLTAIKRMVRPCTDCDAHVGHTDDDPRCPECADAYITALSRWAYDKWAGEDSGW